MVFQVMKTRTTISLGKKIWRTDVASRLVDEVDVVAGTSTTRGDERLSSGVICWESVHVLSVLSVIFHFISDLAANSS